MNVLGIISEYNPFHNGHGYHLQKSIEKTKADYTVCIMSGHFLQRGEPALFDKWQRAEIAIENGIDLVLELPTIYACNSAEYFGHGAVKLLDGLGCVTHLSFGSESGQLDALSHIASILVREPKEFKTLLHQYLDEGVSFPKAREKALIDFGVSADDMNQSNNILGIEYIKSLIKLNSSIQAVTVKRFGSDYNDPTIHGEICSATAIRATLNKTKDMNTVKNVVSPATFQLLTDYISKNHTPTYLEDTLPLLQYELLSSDSHALSNIFSFSEGIENRIIKTVRENKDVESLINSIKSKRYTQTRIQRMLMHVLLKMEKEPVNQIMNDESTHFLRILGASENGFKLIRHLKKNELNKYPLITNINKEVSDNAPINKMLKYDIRATDTYNTMNKRNLYANSDYVKRPIVK